jgi:hypothetical protein
MLNLCCFCTDPLTGHLVPTPTPSQFGPTTHTPMRAPVRPNRPIWPNLFIRHQAPPTRVPRATAAVPRVAGVRVRRPPCVAAARVRRPPCAAAAHVCQHPPIVDHAHSSPILSGAGPPSSPAVDRGHQIRVLRATDFAWSRPVGDHLPHIHRVPSLRRQAAHSSTSPQIHRATDLRPRGRRRPWEGRRHGMCNPEDWICVALTTYKADVTARRATF